MKTLEDIPFLENVPVLVRLGLNVPLVDGKPSSTFRLRRAISTVKYLQEHGARVIVIGHIGRDPFATIKPVYEYLRTQIAPVSLSEHVCGSAVRERIRTLTPGEVLVLENVRRNKGEIENDITFAKELASLADVFVQDAFDTCHRNHASIVGVPQFLPSYGGKLLEAEIRELQDALRPKKPSLALIGGAKFATKEPLIEKLLGTYDRIFIGGALGNDLLKARGYEIGKSITSQKAHSLSEIAKDARIIGPVDAIVSSASGGGVRELSEIEKDDMIVDAGPRTIEVLREYIEDAKSILWNGPLGYYEHGYAEATKDLALAIAGVNTHAVVGGGDTVASIEQLHVEERFSFISTGGGAMLEFLTHGTLPGIEALN
ncbi:MAG: phosphoglycerate kinase [Patescibacteria group bacterium UBA2103]